MEGRIVISFLAIYLAGFFVGVGVGGCQTEEACQRNAIKAGVAYWKIDPTTGTKSFVYGVASKPEPGKQETKP